MDRSELVHAHTEDKVLVDIVRDGNKNLTMIVSGEILHKDDSVFDLIDLSRVQGNPKSLRLDSISFAVESGLKCILKYRGLGYRFPLEGRGKFETSAADGIRGHEIDLILKGTGSFFLILDIEK